MIELRPIREGISSAWVIGAAWLCVSLLAVVAYGPGLSGPFVLDDFTTIAQLGNLGGVTNWETFNAFVFGGTAGPTGRPVALLSFLIDGNNWPTEALPFKRTNLIIHLLNGGLLFVLTRQVLELLAVDRKAIGWLSFVSAAAWLLHPFLVSTTLYAVQRMAQLAMLFSLIGLICYLHGRSSLATKPRKAYLIMTLAVSVFTTLAMLSKENGILLPMFILAIEGTLVASRGTDLPTLDRRWSTVFIAAPSLFIVAYLGYRFFSADFLEIARPREFSLYERLLTQPRVVADYLQNWFLPKLYTTGVFQDHVVKSTGLFTPLSTFIGFVFHGALITLAIARRRQLPLIAFAVLFFYASHLLESTTLNLEMYFEHRNYMAVAFVFLPLIVFLGERLKTRTAIIVTVAVLGLLTGFTRYSATVWSNYEVMVAASAAKAPTSARAQSQYAINLFNSGRYDEATQVLDRAVEEITTDSTQLLITRLVVLCNLRKLKATDIEAVSLRLVPKLYDPRYLKFYSDFAQALAEERCPPVGVDQLRPVFAAMLDNPLNREAVALSHLHYLAGYVDAHMGRREGALQSFSASLEAKPDAGSAMTMAALMATAGFLEEALLLSDRAIEYLGVQSRGVRLGKKVTEDAIHEFQRVVREDMQSAGT